MPEAFSQERHNRALRTTLLLGVPETQGLPSVSLVQGTRQLGP